MAPVFSAASMSRRIGGKRKVSSWSMAAFSRSLSAHLREKDPEFRAKSDRIAERNARRAK